MNCELYYVIFIKWSKCLIKDYFLCEQKQVINFYGWLILFRLLGVFFLLRINVGQVSDKLREIF